MHVVANHLQRRTTSGHRGQWNLSSRHLFSGPKAEQQMPTAWAGGDCSVSIGTIILIILVIALLGGFSGIGSDDLIILTVLPKTARTRRLRGCVCFAHHAKNSPRQISLAEPRRYTCFSHLTVCTPPCVCTLTGDSVLPATVAATAAAHDPVPED